MSASNPAGRAGLTVFRYDPEQRKVSFAVAGVFLLCALAFPALRMLDETQVPWPLVALGSPGLLLAAIGLAAHGLYTGGIRLELHPQGVVYKTPRVETRFAYAEIASLRYRLVHVIGGAATYHRGFVELRLRDGRTLRPTIQLENVDDAISELFGRTLPTLGAEAYGAIRAGGTLRFGPYQLMPQGVVLKGTSVPWARAAIDQEAVDAKVRLLDVDPEGEGYREVGTVEESQIENPHVLVAVAERLRAEALRHHG